MAPNVYANVNNADPARAGAAVSPNDSTDLTHPTRGLYVGGAGNIVCTMLDNPTGDNMTFVAVPAGTILPICVKRVLNTNTTATSMIALF